MMWRRSCPRTPADYQRSGIWRGTQGSAAIEYGVLLPALLLFVFVVIDVGRLFWTQVTLDRAVEAAARCGAIDTITCGSATAIQDYAVSQAYGMDLAPGVFTAADAACGSQVTASFSFSPSIPLLSSDTIALTASSCYAKATP